MKNKKWLLLIPSAIIMLFLWNNYAFIKIECICPWNKWGFMIVTAISIIALLIQTVSLFILIKRQSQRIYVYYGILVLVGAVLYIILIRSFMSILTDSTSGFPSRGTSSAKTEVKTVNGIPRLFIGGEKYKGLSLEVYYYPAQFGSLPVPNYPEYPSKEWVSSWKKIIDTAQAKDARLIMARIWWSELDKSATEPKTIDANFNYTALDEVMNYAAQKDMYMIIKLEQHMNHPLWYREKYNIPDTYEKDSDCQICSKDSQGYSYDDISDASIENREVFSGYISSVVNRYKNHRALAGWSFSLGPTGEDNFCPNYIYFPSSIRPGESTIGWLGERVCGYSPVEIEAFHKWLTEKYNSSDKLSAAWGISASLDEFEMPKYDQIYEKGNKFNNPYFGEGGMCESGEYKLTTIGLDFCNFRIEQRQSLRNYYIELFKSLDSNHVFLANMDIRNEQVLNLHKLDGLFWNSHLNFNEPVDGESDQYLFNMQSLEKIISHGKLAIISSETKAELDSMHENTNYLIGTGKGVKCAGGIPGYTADLSLTESHMFPVWGGSNQMNAVKQISEYTPESGCKCNVIKELYQKNKCDTQSRPKQCSKLDEAYKEFCNITETAPTPNGGSCGDGICQDIEHTSGLCSKDCI